MASFDEILSGLGGDLDKFEGEFYEFLKAKKAAEPVETKKKRKSSPGSAKVNAELKEEVADAEKAAVKAVKEGDKRIARMSPAMAKELQTALTAAEIPHDEKVFKKLKEEFRDYVNELTDDDYKKSSLPDHMRDFANLKKEEAKPETEKVEEKPKKKGGRKPKAEQAEKEVEAQAEAKPEAVEAEKEGAKPEKKKPGRKPKAEKEVEAQAEAKPATGGGAANFTIKKLTLDELMERSESLVEIVGGNGIYFDSDSGDNVTGPQEDSDEEMEELTFDGKTFAVGETTGRVYEQDAEGLDVFVGFKGVGKFKHM
jgi:hypothetical protein